MLWGDPAFLENISENLAAELDSLQARDCILPR